MRQAAYAWREFRRLLASHLVGWSMRVTPKDDAATLIAFEALLGAMAGAEDRYQRRDR